MDREEPSKASHRALVEMKVADCPDLIRLSLRFARERSERLTWTSNPYTLCIVHDGRAHTKTTWPVFHDLLLFTTEDDSVTPDLRPKHWWALRLQENIPSPELIVEMFPPSSLELYVRHGWEPIHPLDRWIFTP